MTSVEWLFNELWDAPKDKFIWHSILNQAKEMHRQEMATTCKENLQVEMSDEHIQNEANYLYVIEDEIEAFIQGAKWYREQLKH